MHLSQLFFQKFQFSLLRPVKNKFIITFISNTYLFFELSGGIGRKAEIGIKRKCCVLFIESQHSSL